MNKYICITFIFFFILICTKKSKEHYTNDRPPGPWGKIGQGNHWYNYPYTLSNIEYYF